MTVQEFNAALEKLGLTQGQAAKALGLSIRTVNGYATGEYPITVLVSKMLRLMVGLQEERK